MNDRNTPKQPEKDPAFIPGIYNYCDRWCQRCPLTSRCMTFRMSQEKFGDSATADINNAAFWEKLGETFSETLDMIQKMAEELGIDPASFETEPDDASRQGPGAGTIVYLLLHLSKTYPARVDKWFEPFGKIAGFPPDDPTPGTAALEQTPSETDTVAFGDAVEVVRWYQYQIHIKLQRALDSAKDEKSWDLEDLPKDSDGSAKVALVGIDRSIGAWGKISRLLSFQRQETLSILHFLKRLADRVEKEFPAARSFVRPGFDDPEAR